MNALSKTAPAGMEPRFGSNPGFGIDCDVAIIGGGCAGLSLAARLASLGERAPRTLILEPRQTYENDRTWSGWRTKPHPFLDCVRASWSRWSIACEGREIVRGNGRMLYDTIPADRFYESAIAAIARAPAIDLVRGVSAGAIGQNAQAAWVQTDQGRLRTRLLIDTRPPPVSAGEGLLQSFTGIEVETPEPRFDPATVGLMAFEAPARDDITFLYTLPFSPTRALLELTRMSPVCGRAPAREQVRALLRERLGCDFIVHRHETGCLPMIPLGPAPPAPPRMLRMGTLAGALRASTGYGFANIQAQAEDLARRMDGGAEAALGWRAAPPPAWMRGMDRLFLQVLRRHPENGPRLLTTLFRRCPTAPLVRFLTGTGGLLDGGRVALSMPKAPFLRELAWPA